MQVVNWLACLPLKDEQTTLYTLFRPLAVDVFV
jgi:hypothetical protein